MPIRIADFSGTVPVRSRSLLPDNYATLAENVKLKSGELRGLRVPVEDEVLDPNARPKRIFRLRNPDTGGFVWTYSVEPLTEIVRNPLVNDEFGRWYRFARDKPVGVGTFAAITTEGWSPVSIPYPSEPPALETSDIPDPDQAATEDRVYVIAWVTEWGEESVQSPPATITIQPGRTVRVSNFYSGPTNELQGRAWKSIRIYRSVVGETTTQLYFVADVPWNRTEYVDALPDTTVVFSPLAPSGQDAPPDGLQGARVHPSGSIVAFKDRDIYFSEPYTPHAWPAAYRLSVEDEIVALEVIGQSVLVMTRGSPVVLFGVSPISIGVNKFTSPLPCANALSVVAFSDSVYYLSPEGLVQFTPNGPNVVSQVIVSKEEWLRNFYAEDFYAVRSESDYVALRADGTGFVFAVDKQELNLQTLRGFGRQPVLYRDPYDGQVWFCRAGVVYRWDPAISDETTYRWRSKEFRSPRPLNYASVVLEFDEKPYAYDGGAAVDRTLKFVGNVDLRRQVIFRAWADKQLVCELVCENLQQVNLPSGFEATRWVFELEGQCRVHAMVVTESGVSQRAV